jgi:hypothetical protein
MLKKAVTALAAATLWSVVPQAASAGYYCYGYDAAFGEQCAVMDLYSLRSPRWDYSGNYPYYVSFYSGTPQIVFGDVFGGCYLIRRPVLTPSGWHTRTVQRCD